MEPHKLLLIQLQCQNDGVEVLQNPAKKKCVGICQINVPKRTKNDDLNTTGIQIEIVLIGLNRENMHPMSPEFVKRGDLC